MHMIENDYHARRAAQERALAARAADESARRIHLDLAARHAAQVVKEMSALAEPA